MKKISIAILTLATLWAGSGCKKPLEKDPLANPVDETFYKTDQDLLAAVYAAYSNLNYEGDGTIYVPLWAYGDIPSDDARKGSSLSDIAYWNANETFTSNPDDAGLLLVWQQQYLGIHRANLVLERAPLATQASEKVKNNVIAEAKFLRAYYHFYLLRMFGWNEGIPLITKVLAPGEFEQGKTDKETVFGQIEQDLIDAAAALPERGGIDVGRADKGAALGLLARVYLFHNKMDQVLATTETIIQSGKYKLLPILTADSPDSAFAAIFQTTNKNSAESLFEIQFQSELNGNWFGTTGTITQVMTRGRNNKGWGFDVPTQSLVDEFEINDPRYKGTIYTDGDKMFYNETFAAPDSSQYPYQPYGKRKYIENKDKIASNLSDNPNNYIIVRYADILLMAAEAALSVDEAKARGYLNQVRARAGMPVVKSNVTGTALRDAIWHERRVELALESLRYFDLIRQGRAGTVLRATGEPRFHEGQAFRDKVSEAFPIPQQEINLSQGKLTQNTGY